MSRQLPALAFLLGLQVACEQPSPFAPSDFAAARIGALTNPGPPRHGLAGRLTGIAAVLQVQDARLMALADACQDPCPDPGRQAILAALAVIQGAASSIADRAAELERRLGVSDPPDPGHPPDPGVPPNPCQVDRLLPPVDPDAPPSPCLLGLLGSIGNLLQAADSRLAGVAELVPDSGELVPEPGMTQALANIRAAAMSLAQTAGALADAILK